MFKTNEELEFEKFLVNEKKQQLKEKKRRSKYNEIDDIVRPNLNTRNSAQPNNTQVNSNNISLSDELMMHQKLL